MPIDQNLAASFRRVALLSRVVIQENADIELSQQERDLIALSRGVAFGTRSATQIDSIISALEALRRDTAGTSLPALERKLAAAAKL